jgi:hypothetical protein
MLPTIPVSTSDGKRLSLPCASGFHRSLAASTAITRITPLAARGERSLASTSTCYVLFPSRGSGKVTIIPPQHELFQSASPRQHPPRREQSRCAAPLIAAARDGPFKDVIQSGTPAAFRARRKAHCLRVYAGTIYARIAKEIRACRVRLHQNESVRTKRTLTRHRRRSLCFDCHLYPLLLAREVFNRYIFITPPIAPNARHSPATHPQPSTPMLWDLGRFDARPRSRDSPRG